MSVNFPSKSDPVSEGLSFSLLDVHDRDLKGPVLDHDLAWQCGEDVQGREKPVLRRGFWNDIRPLRLSHT